jgi:hypothetical protein
MARKKGGKGRTQAQSSSTGGSSNVDDFDFSNVGDSAPSVAAIQERHKRERKKLKQQTDKMIAASLRTRTISDPAHQQVLAEVAKLEQTLVATHAAEIQAATSQVPTQQYSA